MTKPTALHLACRKFGINDMIMQIICRSRSHWMLHLNRLWPQTEVFNVRSCFQSPHQWVYLFLEKIVHKAVSQPGNNNSIGWECLHHLICSPNESNTSRQQGRSEATCRGRCVSQSQSSSTTQSLHSSNQNGLSIVKQLVLAGAFLHCANGCGNKHVNHITTVAHWCAHEL